MKIAIATAVYYPMINGVAVFTHNLAVGLAKRGHEVLVLCPSQTGKSHTEVVDGVRTAYLRSVDVKVYPDQIHAVPERKKVLGRRLPRVFYRHGFRVSVFPAREVAEVLGEFQPDVVHVQVSDPIGLSVVGWARKRGVPVVTTEHNQPEVLTGPLHMPVVMRRPVNAMLSAYFANRQSKSDFVTMPTEQAIRHLLSGRRELTIPIAAVSNGVDLGAFRPGRAAGSVFFQYGLDPTAFTVLYVGRVDPEKNVEAVIRAYRKARAVGDDSGNDDSGARADAKMQLVIVGDGVDRARLMKMTASETDIHFLGRIVPPELYKVYRLGDVFVTASEIETQGIVLIEAAACGLPLVAVDAGAVGEVCVDSENGVLCQPGDIDGMAAAMVRLSAHDGLRRRYGVRSIEIAKKHDLEQTLTRFENIYKRVIRGKE